MQKNRVNSNLVWKEYTELSQNSMELAYDYLIIQTTFVIFLQNVKYILIYQNPKFQLCIILAFCKKNEYIRIRFWYAGQRWSQIFSRDVTLVCNVSNALFPAGRFFYSHNFDFHKNKAYHLLITFFFQEMINITATKPWRAYYLCLGF